MLDAIRKAIRTGDYDLGREHWFFQKRRNIGSFEIEQAIGHDAPEIVKEYTCSYLMLGWLGPKPLHVVASPPPVKIITCYYPDPRRWETDWKTEKRRRRRGES